MTNSPSPATLPRITIAETLEVLLGAGGPLFAKGIIVRRPWVVALLHATGIEGAAVTILQKLRRRYGEGPVLMRLPFREQAILLSPDHVRRVLQATPDPFQSDSSEKHATLAHFEPRGSLISRGAARAERRRFNEKVLETARPIHSLEARFSAIIEQELARLLPLETRAQLSWGAFKDSWFRIVRRSVFGDRASDDKPLIQLLIRLRGDANWAFLRPKRKRLRARFLSRVESYLEAPQADTLAALAARMGSNRAGPADQIAQWLFAFDAAGIALFRALAVLASDERLAARARDDSAPNRPFLRACMLEAVRLWPTTPAILRQTDRPTRWGDAEMPKGTGVLIHVPFLHRDDERLPFAHRFAPDIWLSGEAPDWPLIPFSGGPGECPAKNLVLLLASRTLAGLLIRHRLSLPPGAKLDPASLPPTFDQFSLTLDAEGAEPVTSVLRQETA